MKKAEIAIYLILAATLAGLKMANIIDEASIAWAIGVIGLARGFVYQKEQTKKEREEKKELKHQIELLKNGL